MTSTETRTVRELAEEVASYSCPCEPCKTIFAFVARIDALEKVESLARAIFSTREGAYGTALWDRNIVAFVRDIEALRAALSPPSDNSDGQDGSMK